MSDGQHNLLQKRLFIVDFGGEKTHFSRTCGSSNEEIPVLKNELVSGQEEEEAGGEEIIGLVEVDVGRPFTELDRIGLKKKEGVVIVNFIIS